MLIATFNCNSVRVRLPIILAWLEKHSPDVLALQETKCTDEQFPADAFTEAGWFVVYRGQKSYNGVAMVTAELPEEVFRKHLPGEGIYPGFPGLGFVP